MKPTKSATQPQLLEDLTIAILAINNVSLEKVFSLRGKLQEFGLFDPKSILLLDRGAIADALRGAGYERGRVNLIFADRIKELSRFVAGNGLDKISGLIANSARNEVEKTLLGLHGVGPAVVRNFWILQGDDLV